MSFWHFNLTINNNNKVCRRYRRYRLIKQMGLINEVTTLLILIYNLFNYLRISGFSLIKMSRQRWLIDHAFASERVVSKGVSRKLNPASGYRESRSGIIYSGHSNTDRLLN